MSVEKKGYADVFKKSCECVRQACYNENNYFGNEVWDFHIKTVLAHVQSLGVALGADLQVLEQAALFHDYACLVNLGLYQTHHIHSQIFAEKFLANQGFSDDKLTEDKICIFEHRGSVKNEKTTLESRILSSADAMAHITEPVNMLHLTFRIHGYDTKRGVVWLKGKIMRSYDKIMDEGKKIIQPDYEYFLQLLDQVANKNIEVVSLAQE